MKKLVVLVCLLAAVAVVAIVLGCDSNASGARGATDQFLQAWKSKNVNAMWSTLTRQDQAKLNREQLAKDLQVPKAGPGAFTWSFGKVEVKGNDASVAVVLKEGKDQIPYTFRTVKQNGKWKVSYEGTFGGI